MTYKRKMNNYPRVLVVSNNSFSKTSSNGRTLGNLFVGWPKEKLAQFCISTTEPDYEICENYFLLTDKNVLNGLKRLRKGEGSDIRENKGSEGNTIIAGKKAFKTPWKTLARHFVWSCKRWNSKSFQKWINEFAPEMVVVMNSDATFILDIANYISVNRNIPIVMYNTEGFYFFKENYFYQSKWFSNAAFHLYQFIYKRHFRMMMKRVVLSVHLNSMLQNDYRQVFGGEHMVLYTGSSLTFDTSDLHVNTPTFTYLGNFGYNRPSVLIEIAECLQSISPIYRLDVYGKVPYPEIKSMFEACPGINYRGMISYKDVINVMYKSTILFHAESQENKFEESLRYGFSTKIADSISSGHPFLMYSSPDIAGAKYVIETGAAWHAKNKTELKNQILTILKNEKERNEVLEVAKEVAQRNHNVVKISEEWKNLICSVS